MFEKIYDILIAGGAWLTILNGLWATVKITALSLLFGTLLGAVVCSLRRSKYPFFRYPAIAYISILRGSPVLLLLMLLYYVVFARSPLSAEMVAVITFGLNTAAYVAELMRSALDALDRGQLEAARTLGFSRAESFRLIALPQAMQIARPVYQSTVVNLLQWTSVVGYVTITDLTRVINNISIRTMQPLFMIIVGILLYLLLSYTVNGLFALQEYRKKLKGGNR
ncbi:MAG: amino acid ABC transporter permease [Bacillota bacterium]|nr:amino acid ABC transporter permease [Bacillota bacterium]